jgi:hypothetical protein
VEVRNVRQGFFEANELQAILNHLEPDYRPLVDSWR